MKITICALGSRGDIQPYLALAIGLQQAGHCVTLAAPYTFAEWIRSYGVNAHLIRFNPQQLLRKTGTQGRNLVRQLQTWLREMDMSTVWDDCWQAAQEAEFVVLSGTTWGIVDIASQRNIPMAFAVLQPSLPTRAFPTFYLPFRFSLGGKYNYTVIANLSSGGFSVSMKAPTILSPGENRHGRHLHCNRLSRF